MWYRKEYDKRKFQQLARVDTEWPKAAYFDNDKNYYVRLYKGSNYTWIKREGRRKARRVANRTGIYNKNYYDVWWTWI